MSILFMWNCPNSCAILPHSPICVSLKVVVALYITILAFLFYVEYKQFKRGG